MRRTLAKQRTASRKTAKPKGRTLDHRFAILDKRLTAIESALDRDAAVNEPEPDAPLAPRLSPDEEQARGLGESLAREFLNDDHPRVMDGERPLQALRNLRNTVRCNNGGTFHGEAERPLYRAFLDGIVAAVRTGIGVSRA